MLGIFLFSILLKSLGTLVLGGGNGFGFGDLLDLINGYALNPFTLTILR